MRWWCHSQMVFRLLFSPTRFHRKKMVLMAPQPITSSIWHGFSSPPGCFAAALIAEFLTTSAFGDCPDAAREAQACTQMYFIHLFGSEEAKKNIPRLVTECNANLDKKLCEGLRDNIRFRGKPAPEGLTCTLPSHYNPVRKMTPGAQKMPA
jgi:hypothetical protein